MAADKRTKRVDIVGAWGSNYVPNTRIKSNMPTSIIKKTGKPILDGRKEKLRPWRQDQVRQQIQVRSILNILQDHVLNGTEIAHTRLTTGLALLKKVLPDALPDAVTENLNLQAIQQLQQSQLKAMALEMLQGNTIDSTVDHTLIESIPGTSIESIPQVDTDIETVQSILDINECK